MLVNERCVNIADRQISAWASLEDLIISDPAFYPHEMSLLSCNILPHEALINFEVHWD